MKKVSYQEKLSRQFTSYAAGMVVLLFAAFTVILLIYTLGLNTYRNAKNNALLSEAFALGHQQHVDFLQSPDTQELFLRRLRGEVSDKYTSYRYSSFSRTTALSSSLILTDSKGDIVYASAGKETLSSHLRYFNLLVQQNLTDHQVYTTAYRLFEDTGKYVLAIPVLWENGAQAGAAAIYVDGSGWEAIMRQNQFDGIITDEAGRVIAASNWTMADGLNLFSSDADWTHLYMGEEYWLQTSFLPGCEVYIHTFLKNGGIGLYYGAALMALAVLLAGLLLTGRAFSRRIANLNSQSLETLYNEINAIQTGEAGRRIQLHTGDEFEDIAHHINTMLDHLEALSNRNLELGRLNSQMERLRLEAQFDPHFLYNTLESIRYAIRLGDKDADAIILKLTALLRYSISAPEAPVTLREDLLHLQDYLAIIQYRFQDRFHYELSIPDSCLYHPCPRLCLQPIVENSVKYGLQQQPVLTVTIRAWEDGEFLYLEVEDNGLGMSPELLSDMRKIIATGPDVQSTHHGLRNIARRLALQFGPGSAMKLDSTQAVGTRVQLQIAHVKEVRT